MTEARHDARARRSRSNLRQAHWGLISQGTNTGTNFLLSILVARSVPAAEFGQFSLLVIVYIIAIGVVRATGTNVLTVEHARDAARLHGRARDNAAYAAGLGTALGAGCLGAAMLVSGPLRPVLTVLGVAFPVLLVQDAVRGLFFAQTRPAAAAANDLVWAFLQLVGVTALLVTSADPPMWALVACWAGGGVVAGVLGLLHARLRPAIHLPHRWLTEHWRLAAPLVGTWLLLAFPLYATLLLMPLVAGLGDVGVLRAAYLFYGPLGTLYAGVFSLTLVDAVRATGPPAIARLTARVSIALACVAGVWGLVVVLLPDRLGQLVLGPTWYETSGPRWVLAVCLVAEGVLVGATAALGAMRMARRGTTVQLVTAPLTLALALVLAGQVGATGAAIGIAIGNWICALVIWARVPAAVRDAVGGKVSDERAVAPL